MEGEFLPIVLPLRTDPRSVRSSSEPPETIDQSAVSHARFLVAPSVDSPGSSSVGEATASGLVPVDFEAESLQFDEASDSIIASGSVHATYEGFELHAGYLRFDRRTMQGEARGPVHVDYGIYHLRADAMRFDLGRHVADADNWQATIEHQGWFGGTHLHLSDSLIYSEDVRLSPCAHEDPGYWLAGDRLEWYPKQSAWNLRGQWMKVLVGGVPVFVLPFLVASIGAEAARHRIELPQARINANVGFDGAQGLFIDNQAPYQFGPDYPGSVPVRLMSNRGVSAGLVQDFPALGTQGHFDSNYTQYFPWLNIPPGSPDAGREGGHANMSLTKDWGGGTHTVMNLGYRVDVGYRNDRQYQVDPGGFPIHRLPEIITTWPSYKLGMLSLNPTFRTAYLYEDLRGVGSGIVQGTVGLGLPSWHPNAFWETGFYGGLNGNYYFGDRSQSIVFLGVGNQQHWLPWFSTHFNLETQPVYDTGLGTPFVHDAATPVDRLFVGGDYNVWGPWTLGVNAFWARDYNTGMVNLGDLAFSVRYNVNCLSFGTTFRPPHDTQPFQYTFDYNVVSF